MGAGHFATQRTLKSWVGVGESNTVESLKTIEGPGPLREGLPAVGECQEVSVCLDFSQEPDMAQEGCFLAVFPLLQPQSSASG